MKYITQANGDGTHPRDVRVYMLGQFDIIYTGKSAQDLLNKSKKGKLLLMYLFLHSNRPIPYVELYRVLWPNAESSNPENALKTLVSRLRSILNEGMPGLGELIRTKRGNYLVNPDFEVSMDLQEFGKLAERITSDSEMDDLEFRECLQFFDLYTGGLFGGQLEDAWAKEEDRRLHAVYLECAYHMSDILIKQNRLTDAAQVLRNALSADPFDEKLHLMLMDVLVQNNQVTEALNQYRHATDLHYRALGERPSIPMQDAYRRIMRADTRTDSDISLIREELLEDIGESTAFVCDYMVFREIFQLQLRNFERLSVPIFLALVSISTVDGQILDPLRVEEVMRHLLTELKRNLRKGDTISRRSALEYAILLPTVTYDTGYSVLGRIRQAFIRLYPDPNIRISYRMGPLT